MSDLDSTLRTIHQHATGLDHALLALSQQLVNANIPSGRAAIEQVTRTLARLAEAARPVQTACPVCRKQATDIGYESVNRYSGVWKLPECDVCRPLARLIAVAHKAQEAASPDPRASSG